LWRSLQDAYTVEKIVDGVATKEVQYNQLLLYPAGAAVAAAVLLLVLFHPPAKPVPESVGH
jgi:hypothetical protein